MPRRRRRSRKLKPKELLALGSLMLGMWALSAIITHADVLLPLGAIALVVWLVARQLKRKRILAEQEELRRRIAAQQEAERERMLGYGLEDLDGLSGKDFEAWISAVLRAEGFSTRDLQASGDFGVDVVAELDGVRFGIQAKRYRSNVGNSAVQEANAGADYHDCQISAVVTQSGFTRAAREQASRLDRPCLLIGRAEIGDLARHLRAAMSRAG